MEGRAVLLNGDRIAVRLTDSSYSVFHILPSQASNELPQIEIGDSFLGPLSGTGHKLLLHCRTQSWVEVHVKLARSQVAARTKRFLLKPNPRVAP